MDSEFSLMISSDLRYEDIVAEIYFNNEFVCSVNQEKGVDNLELELYSPRVSPKWVFNLSEFERALDHAKKSLKEMQKLPEEDSDIDSVD